MSESIEFRKEIDPWAMAASLRKRADEIEAGTTMVFAHDYPVFHDKEELKPPVIKKEEPTMLGLMGLAAAEFARRAFGHADRPVRRTSGIRKNVIYGQLRYIREMNAKNGVGSGIRKKRDAVLKAAAKYQGRPLSDRERSDIVAEFTRRQAKLSRAA